MINLKIFGNISIFKKKIKKMIFFSHVCLLKYIITLRSNHRRYRNRHFSCIIYNIPENKCFFFLQLKLVYPVENVALDANEEGVTSGPTTPVSVADDTEAMRDSSKRDLRNSGHVEECTQIEQTDKQDKEGGFVDNGQHMHRKESENFEPSTVEIEMASPKVKAIPSLRSVSI